MRVVQLWDQVNFGHQNVEQEHDLGTKITTHEFGLEIGIRPELGGGKETEVWIHELACHMGRDCCL